MSQITSTSQNRLGTEIIPVSIILKSILDCYQPDRNPVKLITVQYKFNLNVGWDPCETFFYAAGKLT